MLVAWRTVIKYSKLPIKPGLQIIAGKWRERVISTYTFYVNLCVDMLACLSTQGIFYISNCTFIG